MTTIERKVILIQVGIASTIFALFYLGITSLIWHSDKDNTATRGIYFKQTIELKQYKALGSGNGILGDYQTYSRSDRHGETITIYNK